MEVGDAFCFLCEVPAAGSFERASSDFAHSAQSAPPLGTNYGAKAS